VVDTYLFRNKAVYFFYYLDIVASTEAGLARGIRNIKEERGIEGNGHGSLQRTGPAAVMATRAPKRHQPLRGDRTHSSADS
jgi:hypothetical protein